MRAGMKVPQGGLKVPVDGADVERERAEVALGLDRLHKLQPTSRLCHPLTGQGRARGREGK